MGGRTPKTKRNKSGSRYSAGGAAALEEARYPEVAPASEAPMLSAARAALAEGRGTSERAALAEGLRAARRERDPEKKADILANILAYRTKMKADRIRAEPPSPAVMKRVAAAFAASPGASDNLVKLRAVRSRLGDLPRVKVDAAILHLVRQGKFSLDTHEGVSGKLTRSERRAGIRQPGQNPYIYMVQRRD